MQQQRHIVTEFLELSELIKKSLRQLEDIFNKKINREENYCLVLLTRSQNFH